MIFSAGQEYRADSLNMAVAAIAMGKVKDAWAGENGRRISPGNMPYTQTVSATARSANHHPHPGKLEYAASHAAIIIFAGAAKMAHTGFT